MTTNKNDLHTYIEHENLEHYFSRGIDKPTNEYEHGEFARELLVLACMDTVSFSTIRQRLTRLRNTVRAKGLGELEVLYLGILRLPKGLNDYLNERVEDTQKDNLTKPQLISVRFKEVKKLVDKLLHDIDDNPSMPKLELGVKYLMVLCLCSGRRSIELLTKGNFIKISKHFVRFTGQAKIKTQKRADEHSIDIPILYIGVDVFLNHLEALRKLGHKESKSLSKPMSVIPQRIVDEFGYGVFLTKDTMRACRSLYACMAQSVYNKGKSKISEAGYYAKVLGHHEDDLTTYGSYYRFRA